MKDNAKGTVVCVGFERVGVRHLDNGEQGKQDEAQNGGGHHGTGRRDPASSLLEVVQEYLHTKDTQIWTRQITVWLRWGLRKVRD